MELLPGRQQGHSHSIDAEKEHSKLLTVAEDADCSSDHVIHSDMLYGIRDVPPVHTSLLLALQHFLAMFFGNLTAPIILSNAMCMGDDPAVTVELFGVQFFTSGIITIIQILFGVRLPIIQGSTLCVLIPVMSYLQMPKNECPIIKDSCLSDFNVTNTTLCIEKHSSEYDIIWKSRLVTIQGSIMVASLLEILLGLTGAVGYLVKYIGPLTICPTLTLVGISLCKTATTFCEQNWPVSFMTLVIIVIFSQYLSGVSIPVPTLSQKRECGFTKYPLFKSFAVILAILVSWFLCFILTVTNAIPEDNSHWAYRARTDINKGMITNSPWFNMFWPGKYGMPRVDLSLVIGVAAGLVTSVIESIGDYYACARMCCVPIPPKHALNRGILVEGFGCLVSGLFGTGAGTTSYSQNVALVSLTKVASRAVALYAACLMIIVGIFNKFGVLFIAAPIPVIGASFIVLFGTVIAIGLSSLQYINLNSTRNHFVLGFSFFMAIMVSDWIKENANKINTGVEVIDDLIVVLLSTSMFVGGILGFILDNTLPVDKKPALQNKDSEGSTDSNLYDDVYDLPKLTRKLCRLQIFNYLPLCPVYKHYAEDEEEKGVDKSEMANE